MASPMCKKKYGFTVRKTAFFDCSATRYLGGVVTLYVCQSQDPEYGPLSALTYLVTPESKEIGQDESVLGDLLQATRLDKSPTRASWRQRKLLSVL